MGSGLALRVPRAFASPRESPSALVAVAMCLASAALLAAAPPQNGKALLERLFTGYAAGDQQLLERTPLSTLRQIKWKDVDSAVASWRTAWRPAHAAFLFEVGRAWPGSGSLDVATRIMLDRLGRDVNQDPFAIAWFKAAVALAEGQRSPSLLEQSLVAPLGLIVTAEPSGNRDPRLVDPWIELTKGIAEEQWILEVPASATNRGPSAVGHFEIAARSEATRPEALVRKAAVLMKLGRGEDALAALDAVSTGDTALVYWSHLFRGRALEALHRLDEAQAAYERAREVVPGAQSPAIALTSLEMRRGHRDDAVRWSMEVKNPANTADPWWLYDAGEYRLLTSRVNAMRALVNR